MTQQLWVTDHPPSIIRNKKNLQQVQQMKNLRVNYRASGFVHCNNMADQN